MLLVCLGMSLAQADVIGPGPPDCPDGSVASASHSGEFCIPATCADGCDDPLQCEPTGLCIVEVERNCGGRRPEPCTYKQLEVSGSCTTNSDCAVGTCEVADRCVPPPPLVATPAWCGCTTVSGAATAAFLLGLVPLFARRQRDRDAEGSP